MTLWHCDTVRPVERHEDEGVDADEDGDDDEVLHRGAPQPTKGPDWGEGVVRGREGNTEQDEEEIWQLGNITE